MNEFDFSPDAPASLEVFENPDQSRRYSIEFTCPEWTALCPRSGFPDFGIIRIKYEPKASCVELKSLKLYINSYRNQRIFHEGAVNKILTDLVEACSPWSMSVEGDFNVRGNIKTVIRAEFSQ
ncbi:NADPH-dependent 7-cyano-7-deazaguanine reductase QueF [bacterium]|nr:NADPH-dependent 7-cyano-7-deazaguanine reductase QueF [bacterium]